VLDQVVADRQHHVGLAETGHIVVAGLEADRPEGLLVVGRQQALPHEGLGHRDPRGAHELVQRRGGLGANGAVARQRDRMHGPADEVRRPQQLAGRRLRKHDPLARQRLTVRLGGHHVLGELEVRGAGLLALGNLERLAHHLGNDVRVLHAGVPLRDRAHHALQIDVLMRLLVHALEVALAGECDERSAVEVSVRYRCHEVEGARTERAEADPGATGETSPHVGHVRAALLVPDWDEFDRRARQRLVQVERLLTRNPEDMLDALGF
jgi:hypothetical protein